MKMVTAIGIATAVVLLVTPLEWYIDVYTENGKTETMEVLNVSHQREKQTEQKVEESNKFLHHCQCFCHCH